MANSRKAAHIAGFTSAGIGYGDLVLPAMAVVVSWYLGPVWMAWFVSVVFVLAVGGEVFSAVMQALKSWHEQEQTAEILAAMADEAERHANGKGWGDPVG